MEFKLIALRINSEFPLQKNLQTDLLYRFSSDFIFYDKDERPLNQIKTFRDITVIKHIETYPKNLFNTILKDGKELDINITAILGRNGAGKSSILEMLYLAIYCLSERKRYISQRSLLRAKRDQEIANDEDKALLKQLDYLMDNSEIELYYKIGERYLLVSNSGKQTNQYTLLDGKWIITPYSPENFFYTICINYSQYGLNSSGSYFWLRALFHKNDGYLTPLVLNPYREEGNININTELHLAQTRILTNLSSDSFESDLLIDDKFIDSITFVIRPLKIGLVEKIPISRIYAITKEKNNVELDVFFIMLVGYFDKRVKTVLAEDLIYLHAFLNDPIKDYELNKYENPLSRNMDKTRLRALLVTYITSKIMKICTKYVDFRAFTTAYVSEDGKYEFRMIKDSKGLTQRILSDKSHVTLKLKQAINSLLSSYMNESTWEAFQDPEDSTFVAYRTKLDFSKVKKMASDAYLKSKYKYKILAQFIPTAFFKPILKISDGTSIFPFNQLSSGEQQLIHSVHSVLYHILNLDSLANAKTKYQKVNIVLDEIELYYHPKYQQDFINFLLESIKKISLNFIDGLNIIFSTHSPFILSDIPHTNVLKLDRGNPIELKKSELTFGANIHEMLSDAFFLGDSLMGTFAEKTINKCITRLEQMRLYKSKEMLDQMNIKTQLEEQTLLLINSQIQDLAITSPFEGFRQAREIENQNHSLFQLIQLIGEPVVRFKLMEMYEEVMLDGETEKEKTKRLIQKLMKQNSINKEEL